MMTDRHGSREREPEIRPLVPLPRPAVPQQWARTGSGGETIFEQRVGGRVYPMRSVGQCKTCSSYHRAEIETDLLKGFSYAQIARSLPEGLKITARNIGDHVRNGHLPIDVSIMRVMIEKRAEEMGFDIEEYEGALADYLTLLDLGVQQSLALLAEGKLPITTDHAIQFINAKIKLEQVASGERVDQQAMTRQVLALQQAMWKVCTPEQIEEIRVNYLTGQLSPRVSIESRA